VSVEAVSWALNLAPVPPDRSGQPSSACKFVLVGLANHAGPDGTGAFPSVATLVRYTALSERTVRTCLDRLEAAELIAPCDPAIVAARIRRADRRPQGWDLNLSLRRHELRDELDEVASDGQPTLTAARLRRALGRGPNGVHLSHLAASPVDNSTCEVQLPHPASGTRCNQRADGVQAVKPRGAAVAPEPYIEPSVEPSAAPAPARDLRAWNDGGGPVAEFFDALGADWQLTGTQRTRLTPAITAADGGHGRWPSSPAPIPPASGTHTRS
jgi:hypothetical protein